MSQTMLRWGRTDVIPRDGDRLGALAGIAAALIFLIFVAAVLSDAPAVSDGPGRDSRLAGRTMGRRCGPFSWSPA